MFIGSIGHWHIGVLLYPIIASVCLLHQVWLWWTQCGKFSSLLMTRQNRNLTLRKEVYIFYGYCCSFVPYCVEYIETTLYFLFCTCEWSALKYNLNQIQQWPIMIKGLPAIPWSMNCYTLIVTSCVRILFISDG